MLSAVTAAGLSYLGVCALLYLTQRSMLYFPTPERPLPGAQKFEVQSGGETLRVWGRPHDGPRALIYFGGNAEDVAGNFEAFSQALPGRAIYLVNYRGYGGSSGSPTEQGLLEDALAVYDWVQARHSEIAVIGASLGSGVAVHLAASRPVERLLLVSPYDSIVNVARHHYFWLPVSLLLKDRFDSVSRVSGVRARTLVILAERDEVIPRERSDALVAAFPAAQIRVEVFPGATHNSIADSPRYLELIAAFLM